MTSSRICCDLCHAQNKDTSGVLWCPDCDETLCTDCTSHHQLQKATKGHKLVDVNFKAELPSLELSKQQNCTVHSQLTLEYYCPTHDVICCRACLADDHRLCDDVITLDIACHNTNKFLLDELSGEITNIDKTLKCINDEASKNTSVIKNESTTIGKQISQAKSKAIEQINEYEKTLLSKLQSEQRSAITYQNKIKQKCQDMAQNLATHSKTFQFIKEHGTAKQAFLVAHNLKPALEKIHEFVSDIVKSALVTSLKFDETVDLIPLIPMLGKLTKSKQSSQVKYKPIKEIYAQCIVPRTDKQLTSFKLASTFKTASSLYVQAMIVTEDNKLLLCNYTNKQEVLVYSDNGQYVSSIAMQHKPYDIAVIPGGDQYVVTLPHISSIQFINSKDLNPGRDIKLPTSLKVYGISADSLYVYVGEYYEIFVLNHNGTVAKKIKLEDSGYIDYLLINDNNLYTSRSGRVCCHSIDKKRTILQTQHFFVGIIRKMIVDGHGDIYVGEGESGKVHRLDKDLKEIMTISNESVTKITAICFNKYYTKLFLASEGGKTIAVFNCT